MGVWTKFQLIIPISAEEHARFSYSVKMQQKSHCNHEGTNIIEYTWISTTTSPLQLLFMFSADFRLTDFDLEVLSGAFYFLLFFHYNIPWGICKEAEACRAGSHYLHYTQTKWLEDRNTWTWTPKQHIQSRHVPREPQTKQDGTSLCILPYLNISDFLWLEVSFVYLSYFHWM